MLEDFIGQDEISFLINLALCIFVGFIMGFERELKNKDAGVSTHILVITGAMLFTFLSTMVDPASKSRIAAQIVSGIGFLGAGLIIKEGGNVKNLTTAASIWLGASIGMAFGFGYHFIGLIVGVMSVLVIRIPNLDKNPNKAVVK